MVEVTVNNHRLKLFASAEEVPIRRYSRFQKYNLIESGIGSDISSIGLHFGKLFEFIVHKMNEAALQEGKNLYYNFYMLLEEISVPGMAFCCLLHSIDDDVIDDISEDNLKATVTKLSAIGLTQAHVTEWNSRLKKKSITN